MHVREYSGSISYNSNKGSKTEWFLKVKRSVVFAQDSSGSKEDLEYEAGQTAKLSSETGLRLQVVQVCSFGIFCIIICF